MNKDKIADSEILYRVIRKSYPSTFSRTGKLLGAVFIDPKGVSVERDGGRKEQDIIAALKARFKKNDYDCSAKITALNCRNANTYPNPVGNQKNEYHAEIWDSETQQEISPVKAMLLASLCDIVR